MRAWEEATPEEQRQAGIRDRCLEMGGFGPEGEGDEPWGRSLAKHLLATGKSVEEVRYELLATTTTSGPFPTHAAVEEAISAAQDSMEADKAAEGGP
ncbi:hypothetical protein ACFL6X_07655 [Candidatus Latescibacterota bacterium]